jgi:hypothetical protein
MFDFITYMRDVATRHVLIQHVEDDETERHFFRVSSLSNMDELLQCISTAKFPAIIAEDFRMGRYIDNDSENLMDQQNHTFMVIAPVSIENADDREAVIKSTELIAKNIFSKMFRDKRNDHKLTEKTGLRNLDRASIYYQTVGPLGDNCFGIMISFNMLQQLAKEVVYDDGDWLSDIIS